MAKPGSERSHPSLWQRFADPIRQLPDRAGGIKSIALLRGVAVLLVLWDHVVGGWTTQHGRSWIPLRTVRDWLTGPGAVIQDLGFLGVCIFFLVSGYIISEVSIRESRFAFVVKRVLRIYPALIVSILVIIGLTSLRTSFGLEARPGVTLRQTLWAMTLLNYVRAAEAPVNGVAWSLAIEVIFYGMIFLVVGLLRRHPIIAIAVELLIVLAIVDTAHDFPITSLVPNWFLLGANVAYIPLLVIGQAIWTWNTGRCRGRTSAALVAASWLVFVFGMRRIHTEFLDPTNSYGVSVLIAVGIFIAVVRSESRIRVPRWIAAISVMSYSIYLIHGPLTELVLDRATRSLPFTASLVIALAVLAVCSVVLWRLIEVPSQWTARRFLPPRSVRPTPVERPATISS